MTEKAPTADFSQVLGEFNQVTTSREIASRGEYTYRIEARHKWKELSATRDRMLDSILGERGLAECSACGQEPEVWVQSYRDKFGRHTDEIDLEVLKKFKPEDLGVHPKDQMRLHFRRFTARAHQGHPSLERLEQFEELELLCPKHFPKPRDTNKSWGSNAQEYKRGNDIESEVLEKDGKLTTKVGDVDVTKKPISKLRPELVYRYFDLPSLPPEPEL